MVNQVGAQKLDAFGERLTWLLDHVPSPTGERWTFAGLANECTNRGTAISPDAIRQYARGRRSSPPARTIFQIADIFDVDPRYFWGEPWTSTVTNDVIRLAELGRS